MEITWGGRKEHSPGPSVALASTATAVPLSRSPATIPAAPRGAFSLPLHRVAGTFSQNRERNPGSAPWCLTIKAREEGISSVALVVADSRIDVPD